MRTSRIARWTGLCLTGLLFWAALPAFAQTTVGFYFDTPGFTQDRVDVDLDGIIPAYLVLKNPAGGYGVKGWELMVGIEEHATFLGWQYEGQVVNIMDPPQFAVGLAEPLPYQPDGILLASTNVLVTHVLPTDLLLQPIHDPSLPGAMAYLGGPDGNEILPLVTPSGGPVVAVINPAVPGAEVDPDALTFPLLPIGFHQRKTVTLTNVGGADLPLFIELDGCGADFSLPSVSGDHLLHVGATLEIPVDFVPTTVGTFDCDLRFNNPYVVDVPVSGSGREGVIDYEAPEFLYFTETVVGGSTVRSLSVRNVGEVPFDVTLTLPEGCTAFAPQQDYGTVTIPVGAYYLFMIVFSPTVNGDVTCLLDLGDVVAPVELRGSGRDPLMSWHISPDPLSFPLVLLPGSRTSTVTFQSFSEIPLSFTVTLADSTSPFSLAADTLFTTVQPGGYTAFDVTFLPTAPGTFHDQILFGLPGADPVSVSGSATDGNYDCSVAPDQVDFGLVPLGQSVYRYVAVYNTGDFDMIVSPESDSPHFSAVASPPAIAPGNSGLVKITFHPQTLGMVAGTIRIGGGCSEVACLGIGDDPAWGWDQNLVGLYFDPDFTIYDMELDAGYPIFQAYLVLHSPSGELGLAGWECRLDFPSTLYLANVDYVGDVVNILTPPSFAVGIAEPRPLQPSMLLADMTFISIGSDLAIFSLVPIQTPSVVNQMSWLAGDYSTLIPMTTWTGSPEVARVNSDHLVAVELPAPAVVQTAGRLRVTWPLPEAPHDAVRVYRRTADGVPVCLEGAAPVTEGAEMTFTDPGTGLTAGDRVFYSYALVRSGYEIARSGEVEAVFGGVPAARTRLLANVPNPFNPSTEIHFEMERPNTARVDIYDVTGRHVLTLCNESLGAGPHHRTWTGLDKTGRQVPSGAYYVKLSTETGQDTRKVMLLK